MMEKPRIYLVQGGTWGRDVFGCALAEDGEVLAEHGSSNTDWLKHDLGLTSDRKHDAYAARYPDGYEVEWVDDPKGHEGYQVALTRNRVEYPPKDEEPAVT